MVPNMLVWKKLVVLILCWYPGLPVPKPQILIDPNWSWSFLHFAYVSRFDSDGSSKMDPGKPSPWSGAGIPCSCDWPRTTVPGRCWNLQKPEPISEGTGNRGVTLGRHNQVVMGQNWEPQKPTDTYGPTKGKIIFPIKKKWRLHFETHYEWVVSAIIVPHHNLEHILATIS